MGLVKLSERLITCTNGLVLHETCLPEKQTRVFKHWMGAKLDAHELCELKEGYKNRNGNLKGKLN